jgi:hypothetical protein
MFEKNILTFNPGWDSNAQKLAKFTDIRELQRQLRAQGVQLEQQADESTTEPASFIAMDPDGTRSWSISTCEQVTAIALPEPSAKYATPGNTSLCLVGDLLSGMIPRVAHHSDLEGTLGCHSWLGRSGI